MLKLHWLENISFFPRSQSERGKQNSTHKTPHVCSFSKEQVPAGVVAPEIPYPGTSSDPKEVCADSSESLTANKKNYPYFLLCFAPLQTKQNISFPTWVKRSSHSNSFELLVSSASSSQRLQLHSPGSRKGQQDRKTAGEKDRKLTSLPGSSSSGVPHLCPVSAGGFTDSLKLSQLKLMPTATGK